MKIDIYEKSFILDIYGYSDVALDKDYAGTGFRLMDKMWQTVKTRELKNKGINIWVYEPAEKIFAGVELDEMPGPNTGLEHKIIQLVKYAYFRHIGPYSQLKQVGQNMHATLKSQGYETSFPYIEIYGHWSNDESKLETELLLPLK